MVGVVGVVFHVLCVDGDIRTASNDKQLPRLSVFSQPNRANVVFESATRSPTARTLTNHVFDFAAAAAELLL